MGNGFKRRIIIRFVLLALGVIALLSVAAYTVQTQNNNNTTDALRRAMPHMSLPPHPSTSSEQASQEQQPSSENDGIDTDTSTIEYKTVIRDGFTFEAPIGWNSFEKKVKNCTTETIVGPGNVTIDISPTSCVMQSYAKTSEQGMYSISTNSADDATYSHVLATFHATS
ncbi:MAG TPA: hypothetical protein VL576_00880 [Candidatus Paceibacterota bacterium]|jgi:hypothetical protein|nr:hypothetical protein [Candidatus Paceibacterota bacterium]